MTALWIYLVGVVLCVISMSTDDKGRVPGQGKGVIVWIVGVLTMLSSVFFLEGVL